MQKLLRTAFVLVASVLAALVLPVSSPFASADTVTTFQVPVVFGYTGDDGPHVRTISPWAATGSEPGWTVLGAVDTDARDADASDVRIEWRNLTTGRRGEIWLTTGAAALPVDTGGGQIVATVTASAPAATIVHGHGAFTVP